VKTALTLALACLLIPFSAPGCGNAKRQGDSQTTADAVPDTAQDAEYGNPVGPATVLETMDVGTYTYVYVDSGGQKTWWAAPQFQVAVGDTVHLPAGGALMQDFHSETLDRTFEEIYFAGSLQSMTGPGSRRGAGAISMEEAHAGIDMPQKAEGAPLDFSDISKPEGGRTVAEVHAVAKDLAGEEVLLRGKVVKVSSNILSCNWVHVRDGTGEEGTNDLTITTQDEVQVGDTVLVRGTLVTDKDFGYGYRFAVLVEQADLTVE